MGKNDKPGVAGAGLIEEDKDDLHPHSTPSTAGSSTLTAALSYASRRWPVFPCHTVRDGACTCGKDDCGSPGKHPIGDFAPHGLKDATTDKKIIFDWWQQRPDANVAIATGPGFGVVIDIDADKGGDESLHDLQREHGELPPTPTAHTGGGGEHRTFVYPALVDGEIVKNRVGTAPGIDIRAEGGYIVAPPSLHISGRRYEWDAVYGPDTPLAELPGWLRAMVVTGGNGSRPAEPIGNVIPIGRRNATLTSIAGSMRRRGMSEDAIHAALVVENATRCDPLPDAEITTIAGSVAKYEPAREPRHLTDLGNAERLIDRCGETLRYVWKWGKWLAWDGHRWLADDGGVAEAAQMTVRGIYQEAAEADDKNLRAALGAWAKSSESANRRRDLIDQARSLPGVRVQADTLDRDPWLLTVGNGTLDLRDGLLRESCPEDMLTLMTPVSFDPSASCPRWLRFLDEVFQGDVDLIEFIQRSVGYSLTGITVEQVLWLLHGDGSNGKDVFQGTLRATMGEVAYNAPFATFELHARPSIPNDVAALLGRRLVTAAETMEGSRLNEARIKALTGSTVATARFLHGEYFQFEPVAKYWLAVNHLPVVKDDSYAFWRRLRLIPFNRQFKEDADPHLLETLAGELPGILTWAVEGCIRWQEDGLRPPATVTNATADYQRDSDPLAEFLAEKCILHPQNRVLAGRLYTAYRKWAQDTGMSDKECIGSRTFGQKAKSRFGGKHGEAGWWLSGIGLAADGLVDGEKPDGLGGS